mmetsp:Transcript_16393/g.22181  ORF Transcript_16393/g.22181 Transcript_16393/m.22181 type:complete len:114 (+) Transcript_16393:1306-1647(+)
MELLVESLLHLQPLAEQVLQLSDLLSQAVSLFGVASAPLRALELLNECLSCFQFDLRLDHLLSNALLDQFDIVAVLLPDSVKVTLVLRLHATQVAEQSIDSLGLLLQQAVLIA